MTKKTCYVIKRRKPKICKSQEQYHRSAHLHINYVFFWCPEKGPISPKYGKHRAKQELETVPPQELGTVPPRGSKKMASEVVLFLTIRWVCF